MKRQISLTLILLLAALAGCAKSVSVRPGAVDALDSQMYDRLLETSAAIDGLKTSFASGKLPTGAKEYINAAIVTYNEAQDVWHKYHDAKDVSQAERLIALVEKLTIDIATALKKGTVNVGVAEGVQ